jgi:mannose-6-phosphate isomerase-like protein (cupin superfamily)
MLSATLKTGLGNYDIGGKLRTLRLKKKMGLVELGQHTGLSPAMLSKIERGRRFPTLPTLLRIALVFGWASNSSSPAPARSRSSRSHATASGSGCPSGLRRATMHSISNRSITRPSSDGSTRTTPNAGRAPDKRQPHAHGGAEFIYVLKGTLSVQIGTDQHAVGEGDSIYFDSTIPHSYGRGGERACSAIIVTSV